MPSVKRDIGAYLKAQKSLKPQSVNGSADANGTSVDRLGYLSAKVIAETGSATGSPSAQSQVLKVQESADDSAWDDVDGATITITADDTLGELDLNLGARERYLRVVYSDTSTFTGGSSPTQLVAAQIILGGADRLPAV